MIPDPPRPLPGPLDTDPTVAVFRACPPVASWREGNPVADTARQMLAAAVEGIPLGAFDQHILQWLGGCDPSAIATIASIIRRAREAGTQPQTSD